MSIALVQQATVYSPSGGGNPKSLTISTPGAGNTLMVFTRDVNGSGHPTAVSGGGVTWSLIATFGKYDLWMGENSSGSGTTISVTVPNTYARYDITFAEWSGMPTSLTADGGSHGVTTNPNVSTPSVTPSGTPVLLLAAVDTGISVGPSGGFTTLIGSQGSYAYQVADPASGSYQCTWTAFAGYGSEEAGLYAFDGSSGGGGGQPAARRQGRETPGLEGVMMFKRPSGLVVPAYARAA